MNREFVGVSESDRLADAAELMTAESTDIVVVLRGAEPIGSLSTATAMAAMLEGDPHEQSVGAVMEPPVPTVGPEMALSDATQQLISRGVRHLLVVDDGEVVGLLTERDVLAASETVDTSAVTNPSATGETGHSIGGENRQSTVGEPEPAEVGEPEPTSAESTQGICEGCGSLTPELATVNGQLVCPDCRAY